MQFSLIINPELSEVIVYKQFMDAFTEYTRVHMQTRISHLHRVQKSEICF